MAEIYTRRIKAVAGDATANPKITPTPGKRLHSVQCELSFPNTTSYDTLVEQMTGISEIRVRSGTRNLWKLTGTQLRDRALLRGTTYDFNAVSTYVAELTLSFAPEWLLDNVAASLALNPALLGGDITIELDATGAVSVTAFERVDDDLKAPSSGFLELEVIKPVAGGTDFYVEKELDPVGRLLLASIYPDTTNSREITPASLLVGPNDAFVHERLTSAQNDELLERYSLTPAASGRTANIYDMAFVKGDALDRAINLEAWGSAKFRIEAAAAMAGTCSILLERIMQRPR